AEWAPYTNYSRGTVVTYQGVSYTCRQAHMSLPGWEPPNVPALWLSGGSSGGSSGTTSTPTPTPTTPSSGGSSSGTCSYPTWNASTVYVGGNMVQWNGHAWRAQWWTQGEEPGTTGQWGVWRDQGVCGSSGGSAATPTPTPYNGSGGSTGSVSRPAECPSDLWNYMVSATNALGMPADFSWLLAAVCKHESTFGAGLAGSVSAGDGLMQVQPATRSAYAGMFSSTFGHAYNHASNSDQIAMGALILKDMIVNYCGGQYRCGCLKYNGGPNYVPGTVDAYGRPVYAEQYADEVMATYRSYGGTHA
ncbi:MAG: transglycosylase SLT domain-containing protein, partial [Spirochaetales bacterium]|nr:transglycosylase SLT domain-containing protein [Spirochaetales bacterium]